LNLNLFGAGLLLAVCAFVLRSLGWRGAPVFAAVCLAVIVAEASRLLGGVFDIINSMIGSGAAVSIGAGIKIIGLGYLFGICSDICRELGENGVAKAVEVAGRVEIILVALPFLEEIVKIGVELIG
jgi:stage III sporulation protein AD